MPIAPTQTTPLGPAVWPPAGTPADAVQRVVKVRRDYNSWVARETLEDYALRFTPHSFRKWSALRVANTAFGGASSFLVLEAVGATLLVEYGWSNALWAILTTGLIIVLAGLPISRYAAEHGLDMDLLTRGAGFGYIGSTITSLIYASFTFIFFALEAAIMAYALDLAFDIPPAWGYLICAVVVVPLVTHGVTAISRLQVWTQPLWAVLLLLPYAVVLTKHPGLIDNLTHYAGDHGSARFDLRGFGAAMTVGIALMTQMGEQADYLRFMPERVAADRSRGVRGNTLRWWMSVVIGGPGWVVPGVLKMLGGALLAVLAIGNAVPPERAVDPNQMYLAAYGNVFPHQSWAIAATALLVLVSQLKINVTNGYAGSLAWSNFFARLTHSHPGRVVWVAFNIAIALMLMELDVFQALGKVLGLYSNVAISWMMAVVADLVVSKPLGWSPKGIEFKRAHLYDINPVGVGAMGLASLLSVSAYLGLLGGLAQAFSALIALVVAFVTAPLIAWATRGRYYLARSPSVDPAVAASQATQPCTVCERSYEPQDMADCPAYLGRICSLCCALDARCNDLCKPEANWSAQWQAVARRVLPQAAWRRLDSELGRYLLLMSVLVPGLALIFLAIYTQGVSQLVAPVPEARRVLADALGAGFVKAFALLVICTAIVTWWLVLTHKSRQVAQEESNRQTQALNQQTRALRDEIASHRRTDLALQQAKQAADMANQAKSRYISAISHELRTPLNSIIGYAQLLDDDASIPPHRKQAVGVIRRGGDHLLSLIEGTLDMARIEGGKLTLDLRPMRFADCTRQIARLFELQAAAKGIDFVFLPEDALPAVVRSDEKRLRQILINVLGNAVKFTAVGRVVFRVRYAREMAVFEVEDTGPGIAPDEIAQVFEPFARGSAGSSASGSGLGLTIAKMLTDVMGGEMTVHSTAGTGSLFRMRLFLPEVRAALAARMAPAARPIGYVGKRRSILVVDNEEVDRELLANVLEPLGFTVLQAASGDACIAQFRRGEWAPDAVLMDLAMPGSDGWETIRTLQREHLSSAPVAIVTANAFDQGLDNDVGIAAADFVLKPVRQSELLTWLERVLAIEWIVATTLPADTATDTVTDTTTGTATDRDGSTDHGDASPAAPVAQRPDGWPPGRLAALLEAVDAGYPRGVLRQLDEIDADHADDPATLPFTRRLRALVARFEFDAMTALLQADRAS